MIHAPAKHSKFAILRTGKIKTFSHLHSAGLHNSRNMAVPNSDGSGSFRLLHGSDNPEKELKSILHRFNIIPRANAVLASEIILTFSPTMKDQITLSTWEQANMDFIKKRFGEKNILSCHLHSDETTPHIHVLLAPMVEKKIKNKKTGKLETKTRLSFRDFLGGHRDTLVQLQTEYAEAMKPLGLERGMTGSAARHTTIKRFYSEIKSAAKDAEKYSKNLLSIASIQTNRADFLKLFQDAAELIGSLSKRICELVSRDEELTKEITLLNAEIDRKDSQINELILDNMRLSDRISSMRTT